MSEHASGEHHMVIEAEPDAANVKVLGATLVVFLILHFSALVGLWVYFQRASEASIQAQVLGKENAELVQLRAHEAKVLGGYGVVDAKAGTYRVPAEKGIDLFLADVKSAQEAGRPLRMGADPAAAAVPADGAAPAPVDGAAPAAPGAPAPAAPGAPAPAAPAPAAPAPAPAGAPAK